MTRNFDKRVSFPLLVSRVRTSRHTLKGKNLLIGIETSNSDKKTRNSHCRFSKQSTMSFELKNNSDNNDLAQVMSPK